MLGRSSTGLGICSFVFYLEITFSRPKLDILYLSNSTRILSFAPELWNVNGKVDK